MRKKIKILYSTKWKNPFDYPNRQKQDWKSHSMLQIRVKKQKKATLDIHQENFPNSNERSALEEHWQSILYKIKEITA